MSGIKRIKIETGLPMENSEPLGEQDVTDVLCKQIFSNKELSDQILHCLTKSDLLKCSLVSRQWNLRCRNFLRSHHSNFLRINPVLDHKVLASQAELMEKSELNHPFNGIILDLTDLEIMQESALGKFSELRGAKWESYSNMRKICQCMTVKYVVIKRYTTTKYYVMNIGFYVSLLPVHDIEYLKIMGTSVSWGFIVDMLDKRQFANLEILDIPHNYPNRRHLNAICSLAYGVYDKTYHPRPDYLNKLLKLCPAMTEWNLRVTLEEAQEFVLAKKTFLIKKLVIVEDVSAEAVNRILEAGGLTTLTNLEVFVKPACLDLVYGLIRPSTSSLKSLHVNFEFLKSLIIGKNLLTFPKVTDFQIYYSSLAHGLLDVDNVLSNGKIKIMFPNATIKKKLTSTFLRRKCEDSCLPG